MGRRQPQRGCGLVAQIGGAESRSVDNVDQKIDGPRRALSASEKADRFLVLHAASATRVQLARDHILTTQPFGLARLLGKLFMRSLDHRPDTAQHFGEVEPIGRGFQRSRGLFEQLGYDFEVCLGGVGAALYQESCTF